VTAAESVAVSEDAVLGGRLRLRQPVKGHRVGHDAILLAAATAALPGEHLVELGAGVGAAGLAVARRVPGVTVTLVDIDPALTALATENAGQNGLADQVNAACLDATAPADFAAAGLPEGATDRVLMNPPFNAARNPSPDRRRRLAHEASDGSVGRWLRGAAFLLRDGGTVTLIWRADGLGDVLAALASDFGGVTLLPVYPKPDSPAIRVLVRAIKASRAPLALLPGLVLAEASGKPTAQAEAVLRNGGVLALVED
jgi:tRNA1(Val) A37 N6-methylase TrmN6